MLAQQDNIKDQGKDKHQGKNRHNDTAEGADSSIDEDKIHKRMKMNITVNVKPGKQHTHTIRYSQSNALSPIPCPSCSVRVRVRPAIFSSESMSLAVMEPLPPPGDSKEGVSDVGQLFAGKDDNDRSVGDDSEQIRAIVNVLPLVPWDKECPGCREHIDIVCKLPCRCQCCPFCLEDAWTTKEQFCVVCKADISTQVVHACCWGDLM